MSEADFTYITENDSRSKEGGIKYVEQLVGDWRKSEKKDLPKLERKRESMRAKAASASSSDQREFFNTMADLLTFFIEKLKE